MEIIEEKVIQVLKPENEIFDKLKEGQLISVYKVDDQPWTTDLTSLREYDVCDIEVGFYEPE